MPAIKPPWTPQQIYQWNGVLNDPDEPHQKLAFTCLAGIGAPTVTGGWPKINKLDRMRRKGYTMPMGFDPAEMDVPVRFEATVDYGSGTANSRMPGGPGPWSPTQIEKSIQVLEWMGGRGKLYNNGTHPAQGDPPIVQVSSFKSDGTATNLIPPNYHSDAPNDIRWMVSNIQYGSDAIRGSGGDRHRQDATVSLIEYVAVPGAPTSPRTRQQGRGTSTGFKTHKSTASQNTIAKVCQAQGIKHSSDWTTVVNFNQARLHVRSYNATLTPGTSVQIPNSVFS